MFLLRQPGRPEIDAFLEQQKQAPFSYGEVGATKTGPPRGYVVDQYSENLGRGVEVFDRAVLAFKRWSMFETGWINLCWPDAPIIPGVVVCSLASHFGFWSLNPCRIVYVDDNSGSVNGDMRSFAFAFGTLPGHAEQGEERFTVEVSPADNTVWYKVLAFSRPAHPLAKIGYPLARRLQRRFARDSRAAMLRAMTTAP